MTRRVIRCVVRMPYLGVTDWHTLAEVVGDYAVHQRYGEKQGYTVTQISSGKAVCHCGSRNEVMVRLEEVEGD